MTDTTDDRRPTTTGAQRMFGDFAPALVGFTDVLFGQVWTRPGLTPKERSLSAMAVAKQAFTSDT